MSRHDSMLRKICCYIVLTHAGTRSLKCGLLEQDCFPAASDLEHRSQGLPHPHYIRSDLFSGIRWRCLARQFLFWHEAELLFPSISSTTYPQICLRLDIDMTIYPHSLPTSLAPKSQKYSIRTNRGSRTSRSRRAMEGNGDSSERYSRHVLKSTKLSLGPRQHSPLHRKAVRRII